MGMTKRQIYDILFGWPLFKLSECPKWSLPLWLRALAGWHVIDICWRLENIPTIWSCPRNAQRESRERILFALVCKHRRKLRMWLPCFSNLSHSRHSEVRLHGFSICLSKSPWFCFWEGEEKVHSVVMDSSSYHFGSMEKREIWRKRERGRSFPPPLIIPKLWAIKWRFRTQEVTSPHNT